MWSCFKKAILTAVPLGCLLLSAATVFGAAYQLTEVTAAWETVTTNRFQAETSDYQFNYGDDEHQAFALPWTFNYFGQNHTQIYADTNGNIWFNPPDPTNHPVNHDLDGATNSAVISAWNADLNSYFSGGVFIEHKTLPERVVVQWTTESWEKQGSQVLNKLQAVLFQDGTIQFNYLEFADTTATDTGSGISRGGGIEVINLSQAIAAIPTLAGRSFRFNVDEPVADVDGDGLPDAEDPDDDNDGMTDVWEVANNLDPLNAGDAAFDGDEDGLDNLGEYLAGTTPDNPDSDGDGLNDGWEVTYSLNPLDANDASLDSDSDGLTNLEEYQQGTDPWNSDSDGDGIGDDRETIVKILPVINSILLSD
jgi:Bacterial TSP3 repeat